jgi:hypothetical protein
MALKVMNRCDLFQDCCVRRVFSDQHGAVGKQPPLIQIKPALDEAFRVGQLEAVETRGLSTREHHYAADISEW